MVAVEHEPVATTSQTMTHALGKQFARPSLDYSDDAPFIPSAILNFTNDAACIGPSE